MNLIGYEPDGLKQSKPFLPELARTPTDRPTETAIDRVVLLNDRSSSAHDQLLIPCLGVTTEQAILQAGNATHDGMNSTMNDSYSFEAQGSESYQHGQYQQAALLTNQAPFLCPDAP